MSHIMLQTASLIHPTAIIHPSAKIHESVEIGAFCVVGEQVTIDEGTKISHHVVIDKWTTIGKRNKIFSFASIGADCQDLKYKGEKTWLHIGDDNTIRESASLHRGTVQDNSVTILGSRNLLMVGSHLAHDCVIGDDCILANNVGLAGHVHLGNHVIVGGNSGVHQFCRIGSHAMVGGGSTILKDIPAYTMVQGNPAEAFGINIEGLKRSGFSVESINALRDAFKIVYKKQNTVAQALEVLRTDYLPNFPEVGLMIDSIENSTRGIVR